MEMDRAKLLKAVNTVKPALATKELIEELVHVWLDGETITAYNDASLGIQAPFESELKGGIRGAVLLGVLTHSRADEVEVDLLADGWGMIKAGRTKLKLALLPLDRAVHEIPELPKSKGFKVSKAVRDALKTVLVAMGASSSNPEQMGVTCILQGALQFYAIDGRTVAWATVKDSEGWPVKPGHRVTFPAEFVEQLLRLADDKTLLFITEGGVIATTGEGVKLFAHLVAVPKPSDFKKIIDDSMSGVQLFTLPKRLKMALARAEVVLAGQSDEPMYISVEDDLMKLTSKATFGDLDDKIKLEEVVKPVSLSINPGLMERALEMCEHLGFSERTSVMTGKNFVYLIQNFVGKTPEA